MTPEIQRAALRAAARIAFSALVVGCGGIATQPGQSSRSGLAQNDPGYGDDAGDLDGPLASDVPAVTPAADAAVDADAASADAATDDAAPDDAAALKSSSIAQAAAYCADTDPNASIIACCSAEASGADFPADLHLGETPDLRVDPVTRGCCTTLASNGFTFEGPAGMRTKCCEAIGWEGAPACTPWGPPVPPGLDWKPGSAKRDVSAVLEAA